MTTQLSQFSGSTAQPRLERLEVTGIIGSAVASPVVSGLVSVNRALIGIIAIIILINIIIIN